MKTSVIVILSLVLVAVVIAMPVGYILNIVKFCQCDFESPVKAEIIRGIGIIIVPVGVICGYFTIKDGEKLTE